MVCRTGGVEEMCVPHDWYPGLDDGRLLVLWYAAHCSGVGSIAKEPGEGPVFSPRSIT